MGERVRERDELSWSNHFIWGVIRTLLDAKNSSLSPSEEANGAYIMNPVREGPLAMENSLGNERGDISGSFLFRTGFPTLPGRTDVQGNPLRHNWPADPAAKSPP